MMAHFLKERKFSNWWIWVILALLVMGVLLIPLPAVASTPVDRTFRIEASRFEYQPAILKVNPGDHVTIELMAKDVVHGLYIDGYNLQAISEPGQVTRISFIANQQGLFRFHCTVTCGNLHPFMLGKLQVGRNTILIRSISLLGLVMLAAIWKGRK